MTSYNLDAKYDLMSTQQAVELSEDTSESVNDFIEDAIKAIVKEKTHLSGHVRMIISAIRFAFSSKDLTYFTGNAFKLHCIALGVDRDILLTPIITKMSINLDNIDKYIHNNKLSGNDVLAIRASNKSDKILAAEYGTSEHNIYQIRKHITWKHI